MEKTPFEVPDTGARRTPENDGSIGDARAPDVNPSCPRREETDKWSDGGRARVAIIGSRMENGHETCRSCTAAVAGDQRYCLNCGDRIAATAMAWRDGLGAGLPDATAGPMPPSPSRLGPLPAAAGRIAAALLLAAVGTGVVLGSAASPVSSSTVAPRSVIAVAAPTPNPTPVPTPAVTPALGGGASGAGLPDDAPIARVDTSAIEAPAASAGGTEPVAGPSVAVEPAADPVAEPPAEPTPEPEPAPEATPTPDPGEAPAAEGPPAKHVVIVSLTGQSFKTAFGKDSPAAYLSRELPAEGVVLSRYAPVARGSLANQLALLAGIEPTQEQDEDCSAVAATCQVPARAPSLPAALTDGGRTWKAYVHNRGVPCSRPVAGAVFGLLRDPFPYLRGVEGECPAADVDLSKLGEDFSSTDLAPSLAYVIPDFCHDGRDLSCPFEPGTSGLQRADGFLRYVVPAITSSDAFKDDGLLIILFDGGNLPPRPKGDKPPAVGAVVVGSLAAQGKVTTRAYNHLSLLRTLAGTFGVAPPGRSAEADVRELGRDVFPSTR